MKEIELNDYLSVIKPVTNGVMYLNAYDEYGDFAHQIILTKSNFDKLQKMFEVKDEENKSNLH